MSETPVIDIERLQNAVDWAYGEWQKKTRGEVSEWNQGDWMLPTTEVYWDLYDGNQQSTVGRLVAAAIEAGTACGTASCLAGKVAYDAGWRMLTEYGGSSVRRDGEINHVRNIATELLGLTEDQASRLFNGYNTIFDLYQIADQITGGRIRVPNELSAQDPSKRLFA